MDDEVFRKAQKHADQLYPLGEHTPAAAAARTAISSLMLLVLFTNLEGWFGFAIATAIATAVATVVIWLDTNRRWTNHSNALRDAVACLERDKNR